MSITLPQSTSKHSFIRREGIHAFRLLGLILVILLIHFKARRLELQAVDNSATPLSIELVQPFFSQKIEWGKIVSTKPVKREILDQDHQLRGTAFQTSPLGDTAIGFSGPTNVLVVCDDKDIVLGIKILNSRDTPEHVAIINQDANFFHNFKQKSLTEIVSKTNYDGVSGATLTTLAIIDAIKLNAGQEPSVSSRFPGQLELEKIKKLLPTATQLQPESTSSSLVSVLDSNMQTIGWILRTSPAADQIIGYQGPTEAWMIFDNNRRMLGFYIAATFDNEPYVDYVRQEASFIAKFEGKTLAELAAMTLEASGIEGVSGATMTSQAVTASMFKAAAKYMDQQSQALQPKPAFIELKTKDYLFLGIVCFTIIFSVTRMRGNYRLRVILRLLVIVYLGFIYGGLLSQAMWIGWTKYNIPFKHAFGLVVLTVVSVVFPLVTKQNIYCNHLCPHGALQQLIKPKTSRWKNSLIWNQLKQVWKYITAGLLLLVVFIGITNSTFSLVNLEPFDAYIYEAAGIASIVIFIVSLAISWFEPMAYCRFGCPTGSLLDYLRRHPKTGAFCSKDTLLVVGLIIAVVGYFW